MRAGFFAGRPRARTRPPSFAALDFEREISTVFMTHGFGWAIAQLKLRRELQVDFTGADLTRAAVGSPDTGKRLVAAFSKLGPTFVKLGQILSTRPDLLPPGILGELTQLQDQVSPLPFDQVVQQLRLALGPGFREHFETLDEAPLASASIAQVHRATLKDGTAVVLKVQRPGLRPKIESDLNILRAIANWVEESFVEAEAMAGHALALVCGLAGGRLRRCVTRALLRGGRETSGQHRGGDQRSCQTGFQ